MSRGRIARAAGVTRPSGRGEAGLSLVEVVIAVALISIVGMAIGSTLTSSMQATSSLERQSRGLDEARIAMQQIEREFRSAECVAEPAITVEGGSASATRLRFTTRVGGGEYEVTYRVEGGVLYRAQGGVEHVTAREVLADPVPFTVRDRARRTLDVSIAVQPQGKEIRVVEGSIAGRNAWRDC